jgi:glycerol-3-phosphate dehydrogenase
MSPVTTAENTGRLGPAEREQALDRLRRERFDVVVVGAGATGAGCALDAASRGLTVALLEARDFAAGTSSRSSKLIHGGLRYLQQRNFALVREALRERSLLLNVIAPHLVSPVRFLFPLHRRWERAYVGAGMVLYDSLGGRRGLEPHRYHRKSATLRLAPALAAEPVVGGFTYSDGQFDDARYAVTLARTAASYGAVVASNVPVVGIDRPGGGSSRVTARDLQTGEEIQVGARTIVNATGVWTDDVQRLVGAASEFEVRASKGVHLVLPRDRLRLDVGLILPTEKSVLFVIPWHERHWIVGTTDTDWHLDKAHPAASSEDVDYLLAHLNRALAEPVGRDDIEGVYAGLRPLLSGESEDTSTLSREHVVSHPAPGVAAVAGGKWTTYRVMAKDAIDTIAADLQESVPRSCTDVTPLLGAEGFVALQNRSGLLAAEHGLAQPRVERLLRRYGSRVLEVLEPLSERPDLADPLTGADEYLQAEIRYAATHEGALHLDDVLTRRTRISIETRHRGVDSAAAAADLIADVLGWSEDDRRREIELYRGRVEAERASQEQPDDRSANAARTAAPDALPGLPPTVT